VHLNVLFVAPERRICLTGQLLFKLESDNLSMCEFAPDDTRALVEYARDESLTLRDTRTGSTVWTFEHNVFAEGRALGAAAFSPDGHCLLLASGPSVRIWSRRRPEYWWGIAWLPESWIALLSGGALLVIAIRRLRARTTVKQDAA
jgi:WD40 repeat protein